MAFPEAAPGQFVPHVYSNYFATHTKTVNKKNEKKDFCKYYNKQQQVTDRGLNGRVAVEETRPHTLPQSSSLFTLFNFIYIIYYL